MAELEDRVTLTELGVFTRWSLAVRQPAAEREDLIAELQADLDWLQANRPVYDDEVAEDDEADYEDDDTEYEDAEYENDEDDDADYDDEYDDE